MIAYVDVVSDGKVDEECKRHNLKVDATLSQLKPSLIVFTSFDGHKFVGTKTDWTTAQSKRIDFLKTVSKELIWVSNTPGSGTLPNCLGIGFNNAKSCNLSLRKEIAFSNGVIVRQAEVARMTNVKFFDLRKFLCRGSSCPATISSKAIYYDGSHLTEEGANFLSPFFIEFMNER
jgi:hypothetical protein